MQIQLTEIEEYYHLHFSYSGSLLRASYDSIFDYINPRPRTLKVRFCLEKLKNRRLHKREQDKLVAEKKDWALSRILRFAHALRLFKPRGFRRYYVSAHGLVADAPSPFANVSLRKRIKSENRQKRTKWRWFRSSREVNDSSQPAILPFLLWIILSCVSI